MKKKFWEACPFFGQGVILRKKCMNFFIINYILNMFLLNNFFGKKQYNHKKSFLESMTIFEEKGRQTTDFNITLFVGVVVLNKVSKFFLQKKSHTIWIKHRKQVLAVILLVDLFQKQYSSLLGRSAPTMLIS